MSVKERLIEYLKYKKISKSEFGRMINVSSAFITSMRSSLQPDKIKRIAFNFPDLNTEWLLTGEGNMLKSTEQQSESQQDLIERLISIIESQQRTIELLTKK